MALAPMRSCVAPGAPNPSCGGGRSGSCERRPRPAARQDPPAGPQATQPVDHRAVIALTAEDPPEETTHWTAGLMARTVGISVSSVQRIWQAHGLRPHRVRRFKLSKDPEFVPKLRKIVGLYVNPPAYAIVLSVDEKSQIQALDRTQPGLPMKKGRAGTLTHDYKRHGHDYSVCRSQRARRQGDRPPACSVTAIRSSSVF
jgi:hypothetical protein